MASDEARAYRDKLRSIQFGGKAPKMKVTVDKQAGTRTTELPDDERGGGRVAGTQIEHKDGHVDAVITPPVVQAKGSVNQ